jgi:cytochrome b6-f complex iron-sulfur subunit
MPDPTTPGSPAPEPTPAPTPAPAPRPAPTPPKPAAKKPAKAERRGFLWGLIATPFALAWTNFTLAMAAMTLGTVRFLFPNVLAEPPSKVKAGPPDKYDEGTVSSEYKDKNFWIVRYEGKLYALSTTCTHLGCTPNWLEREQKFKCPCHGSGFYITGINFEGPAPRPLERWAVSIGDDGQVVVDKSRKFQEERGEWSNPDSFIKV